MAAQAKQEAQQPLILRAHRLMEAFAKSDDERDFYLDRLEGYILFLDLDKPTQEIESLEKDLVKNQDRYCMIPKLTFYEAKKIMEGFVNEKVYDIDTKEKLLDIIQAKEARENFLEFIYDHHTEQEKWQQYYQERSRIRIIEWLRQNHFHFVFEEDLEFTRNLLERVKKSLFQTKVDKDVQTARKVLIQKAKSYYSNEALNPRPKRGRPPKQVAKQELEPQVTSDIYLTVTPVVRPFIFAPEIASAASVTFSATFDSRIQERIKRQIGHLDYDISSENLQQKLAALRQLSTRWAEQEESKAPPPPTEKVNEVEKQPTTRHLKRLRPTKKVATDLKKEEKTKKVSKEKKIPVKKEPLRTKHKRIIPTSKVAPKKEKSTKTAPSKSTAKSNVKNKKKR